MTKTIARARAMAPILSPLRCATYPWLLTSTPGLHAASDPIEIRGLYLRLVEELSAHEAAEQQVLYPAFREKFAASSDDTLAHRMGDDAVRTRSFHELQACESDGWKARPSRNQMFIIVSTGCLLLLRGFAPRLGSTMA